MLGCDHDKAGHSRLLQNRDGHVGEISKAADVTHLKHEDLYKIRFRHEVNVDQPLKPVET